MAGVWELMVEQVEGADCVRFVSELSGVIGFYWRRQSPKARAKT